MAQLGSETILVTLVEDLHWELDRSLLVIMKPQYDNYGSFLYSFLGEGCVGMFAG